MSAFVKLLGHATLWGLSGYTVYVGGCSIFLRQRKMQLYDKDGATVELSEDMKNIENEIVTKLDWDAKRLASIKLLISKEIDFIQRGFAFGRFGVVIGIPRTFNYKSSSDIEWNDLLRGDNTDIDQKSQPAEELKNSLFISDKAKKFAIAREVYLSNTFHNHSGPFIMAGVSLPTYVLLYYLDKNLYLQRKFKPWFRGLLNAITLLVMFKLYLEVRDAYLHNLEHNIDVKAADLGQDFAEGGVEFYDKLIHRNIALRSLLGSQGSKQYSIQGDRINSIFGSPHLPLERRKQLLQEYINKLKEKQT